MRNGCEFFKGLKATVFAYLFDLDQIDLDLYFGGLL
jgi:hypothetical protein